MSSLLKKRRRELHCAVAEAMLAEEPAFAGVEPEVIARHCSKGGLAEPAVSHWIAAGLHALDRAANLPALDVSARSAGRSSASAAVVGALQVRACRADGARSRRHGDLWLGRARRSSRRVHAPTSWRSSSAIPRACSAPPGDYGHTISCAAKWIWRLPRPGQSTRWRPLRARKCCSCPPIMRSDLRSITAANWLRPWRGRKRAPRGSRRRSSGKSFACSSSPRRRRCTPSRPLRSG